MSQQKYNHVLRGSSVYYSDFGIYVLIKFVISGGFFVLFLFWNPCQFSFGADFFRLIDSRGCWRGFQRRAIQNIFDCTWSYVKRSFITFRDGWVSFHSRCSLNPVWCGQLWSQLLPSEFCDSLYCKCVLLRRQLTGHFGKKLFQLLDICKELWIYPQLK